MQPADSKTAPNLPRDPRFDGPIAALSEVIGAELGETSWQALRPIRRMIRLRGESFVRELVQQAHAIEASGGMWLEKQQRRRTLGGVFFFLAKQAFGEETWRKKINPHRPPRPPRAKANASAPSAPQVRVLVVQPPPPPPKPSTPPQPKVTSWEDGLSAARAAAAQIGEVRTVKVTLIGRPGRVEKRDACIVTSMEHKKAPSLPKGLPPLPATPTRYTVFVAKKQWGKVEEALAKDPEDQLVIEGFAAFMPELGGMGVFAANATTVQLQRSSKPIPSTTGPMGG